MFSDLGRSCIFIDAEKLALPDLTLDKAGQIWEAFPYLSIYLKSEM